MSGFLHIPGGVNPEFFQLFVWELLFFCFFCLIRPPSWSNSDELESANDGDERPRAGLFEEGLIEDVCLRRSLFMGGDMAVRRVFFLNFSRSFVALFF